MIRFDSVEGRWNLASVLAVVVIAGALGYHTLAPRSSVAEVSRKHRAEQVHLGDETKKLLKEISTTRLEVTSHLWQTGPDEIAAQAMSTVDSFARQNMVKVQAFRPQRTVTVDEVTRYPYTLVVQGAFPRVVQLVRKLQDPGTNLAVTSVQISAADGESDTVTSTIGLAAFSGAREEENGKQ